MGHTQSDLGSYFKAVGSVPVLSVKQEKDLAIRIANGDKEARDLLIISNLRLVTNIAKRYVRYGRTLEDLISDGTIGLIRAAEKYDLSYGTKFSTYATYWIIQGMQKGMPEFSIRLPSYMSRLIRKWIKTANELAKSNPSDAKIAKKAGIKTKQIKLIKQTMRSHRYSRQENADENSLESLTASETNNEYDFDEIEKLSRLVNKLPPQELEVIKMRFGINCKQLTLQEIGDIFGVSKERIRQIETQGLLRLKKWVYNNKLC